MKALLMMIMMITMILMFLLGVLMRRMATLIKQIMVSTRFKATRSPVAAAVVVVVAMMVIGCLRVCLKLPLA